MAPGISPLGVARRDGGTSSPKPWVWPASQFWDGDDGSWSTFIVRVGTPSQNFRVLISTAGQETWVPLASVCQASKVTNCGYSRGAMTFQNTASNGFQSNYSSTWSLVGIYDLGQVNSVFNGTGLYGYETIGLDIDSAAPSLAHQVLAAVETKDVWIGQFGLGPKPTNFSDTEHAPSFLRTMKDQGVIPSLSWGYTAGAHYRFTGVLGSLVLGGYDSSRFIPNNISYPFGPDDSRPLMVGVQSIIATNSLSGTVSLSDAGPSNGFLALIDSTVPEMWLPRTICDQFEKAFGLTYDPSSDRYLVNNTSHSQLQTLAPSLSLRLGTSIYGGNTTTIELPYGAFNLQAKYPIFATDTFYFPLRRARNDQQYTLGRAFLQEAYLSVDYERQTFNISQAVFKSPVPDQNIITITAPEETIATGRINGLNDTSHSLSAGGIAGVSVGATLLVAFLSCILWWWFRRKKMIQEQAQGVKSFVNGELSEDAAKYELPSNQKPVEKGDDGILHHPSNITAAAVSEVEGSPAIYELWSPVDNLMPRRRSSGEFSWTPTPHPMIQRCTDEKSERNQQTLQR